MNKLLIVCLLGALIMSAPVSAQEQEENEEFAMATINKIESSKFGQTLLDTIQLQMNSGDPVTDLIQMLRDMEANLQNEQREDDDFIFGLQDQCDAELARLDDEITAAQNRIRELTEELAIKIPRRDQAQADRDQKQNQVNLYNDRVAELDAQKELKDQEWAQIQEEHDRAQYAIEHAKGIITNAMTSKNSLLEIAQIAPVFAQVSSHIKQDLKQYKYTKKSWNSIFSMLAEVTQSPGVQADQSAVQKVISLCEDIIGKISESRELERKAYQHWVSEYQQTRDTFEQRISDTEAEIAQLDDTISVLTRRINMATQEKADQETRIAEKNQQKADKTQWCNDENDSYSTRRQARDDDREVISDAIALFNSQIRLFRKYVSQRASSTSKAK